MKMLDFVLLGFIIVLELANPALGIDENISKLIVQGEGKLSAIPDQVTIVLGVQTRNAKASSAAEENAQLMNQTIEALLASGVDIKDIQTSLYSLALETNDDSIQSDKRSVSTKPMEFIASNRATIKLNNVTNAGKVIDAAIKSGSNDVLSISFGLKDPKNQTEKTLILAIEDAEHKAQAMASAAGVKLGKILELSEGYGYVSAKDGIAYAAAAPITPIQPGELDVTSSVTATYEINSKNAA
ncbi:MAG: SIMPL domain-containing protein [Methanotrichaceae archaeon]|nr:SIMPL domain-containing protein [Methanotrichaceae archaeon]